MKRVSKQKYILGTAYKKIQAESLSIHPQIQKQAIRILINSKTVMKTISEVIDCFNVSKDDIPKEKKEFI